MLTAKSVKSDKCTKIKANVFFSINGYWYTKISNRQNNRLLKKLGDGFLVYLRDVNLVKKIIKNQVSG